MVNYTPEHSGPVPFIHLCAPDAGRTCRSHSHALTYLHASQASGGAFKAHPADVTLIDCEVMHNTCNRKGAAFYGEQGTVRASRRVP